MEISKYDSPDWGEKHGNWYDPNGKRYMGTFEQVLRAFDKDVRDMKNKIVKQETLPNGLWVSTVWLGLDHNYENGMPLIYETMVFKGKNIYGEIDMERYSTREEALIGHKAVVKKYKHLDLNSNK